MKQGIDRLLPESKADLDLLRFHGFEMKLFCVNCKQQFSDSNVKTPAGWAETQISGECESCWDELVWSVDEEGGG